MMNKAIVYITFILAMLVMASCGSKSASRPVQVADSPEGKYVGLDVSRHQKIIDWEKVGADKNITFVYIKATEGATLVDSCYATNIAGAGANGIKVGAYHFFTTTSTVDAQVSNFLRQLRCHHQDLIPMIDVETRGNWSRNQLIDSVSKMAAILEKQYHHQPMIYSTVGFYNANLAPQFNTYPLYIGRFSDNNPPKINWNGKYTIWQFTEDGIVTGITQKVDLCRFNKGFSLKDISL